MPNATQESGGPGDKLLSVEAARGIAAVFVVFYHAARHLDKNGPFETGRLLTQFGHAGVDLFFVISGFIIFFVHAGDIGRPQRLAHYLWRRTTRIFPAYWAILILTVLPLLLPGHASIGGGDLLAALVLLPTTAEPVVGVAWTLQHEMIFYGLFALLILHRGLGIVAFVVWLGLILADLHFAWPIPRALSLYNFEFCAGMLVAYAARRLPWSVGRPVLAIGLVGCLAAAGLEVVGRLDGYGAPGRLAYGIPAALVVLGLVLTERSRPVRLAPPLLWLGRASYSIYLFHLLSLGIFYKLWLALGLDARLPATVCFAGLVLAGVGGGILASRLIEYPAMRLVRRWGRALARPSYRSAPSDELPDKVPVAILDGNPDRLNLE